MRISKKTNKIGKSHIIQINVFLFLEKKKGKRNESSKRSNPKFESNNLFASQYLFLSFSRIVDVGFQVGCVTIIR